MSKTQVAETIAKQLGGLNRLATMVGGKAFAADGPAFQFKFGCQNKLNFCRVELNSMDTYDVKFALRSFSRKNHKNVDRNEKRIEGVYCDQLVEIFEKTTGLFLSL